MALDEKTLKGFVESFRASRAWKTKPPRTVNDEIFFIRRRAAFWGAAHPAWELEAGQPKIKARIELELTAVAAYIDGKLKTLKSPGPLGGSGGGPAPSHLDLTDVARRKVTDKATDNTVQKRVTDAVGRRRERVGTIVWRAAGLHNALWDAAAPVTSPALMTKAMDEILDRRLRSVERMNFNVASHGSLGGDNFNFATATSGWTDGFRVRMFEYPRIDPGPKLMPALITLIGAGKIAEPDEPIFASGKDWQLSQGKHRLEFNRSPAPPRTDVPGVRLPLSIRSNWVFGSPPNQYRIELVPSGATKGSTVIDAMFTPNPDWWKRTWIYCDQAICAIHIEALLLALRRRHGTATGNTTFNALVDGTGPMPPGANPHYVGLDSVIEDEPLDVGFLMEDADDDPFFQNTTADVDDLEIGDHVIFWNSHVYRLISTGVWRLENAYVVDIQSKDDGKVSLDGLHLQGHGTPERAYPAYTEEIAGHLREAIGDALTKIKDAVKANPAVTQIVGAPSLIRWSPYESFGEASLPVRTIRGVEKVVLPEKGERGALKTLTLGAWWVRVPFAEWGSAKKAVMAIPKAIGVDATGIVVSGEPTSENPVPAMQTIAKATGFTTPTDAANSVYFPLLEPRVVSRIGEFPWAAYLRRREADSTFPPAGLDAVVVDGTLMPGLFPRGRNKPQITLVRPKAGP